MFFRCRICPIGWLEFKKKNKKAVEDLDKRINDVAQQVLNMISAKKILKRQQQEQMNRLIAYWLISEKKWACALIITYSNHIPFF